MGDEPLSWSRFSFVIAQLVFWGILIVVIVRRALRSESTSQFRSDRLESIRKRRGPWGLLREVSKDPQEVRLLLEGFVIDRPVHEILGIAPTASASEVSRAYRALMKRYHPDRVGSPGSAEWKGAQKIAEAINRARDEMLKRARSQG